MQILKKLFNCLMVVLISVFLLSKLTTLMEKKDSINKYNDFWKQEDDFDVLFLGTSHVINGIYPMELWNNYGIVSYNFGGHSCFLPTSYWVLENALEKTTPKVVVVDCTTLSIPLKASNNFSEIHMSLDHFPLSFTKIKTIWDLTDDEFLDNPNNQELLEKLNLTKTGTESRTKIGLLWDYSLYHSRWDSLTKYDVSPVASCEKGAETRTGIFSHVKQNKVLKTDSESSFFVTANQDDIFVGEQYLKKIIEKCKAKGIEVLLTYMPCINEIEAQQEANYVEQIASEYNINYLNFLDYDFINYNIDFFDYSGHLNPSGARKTTNYIGNYLISNYDIKDQRNNISFSFWNDDYIEYVDFKNNNIRESENIYEFLPLISNDDILVIINLKNKELLNDDIIRDSFINLGINSEDIDKNICYFICDENNGTTILVDNDFTNKQTEIGKISISQDQLIIEEKNLSLFNNYKESDLVISVFRNDSIVDTISYSTANGLHHLLYE